ncbi:hypothetical protein OB955_04830 [Halobacteria archaeon AArc-m2/3/4]|uniref:MarR family transcriptional regulator n=1 Tax=Natronoglomus mannanivorans TaxID=2979990 RepID=A0ABT2QAW6_9EURY|nr:hypothetical protein [Halobacteria archaeon AArc-m2/3/4]
MASGKQVRITLEAQEVCGLKGWVKVSDIDVDAHNETIRNALQTMEDEGYLQRRSEQGTHYYQTRKMHSMAENIRNQPLETYYSD